MLFHLIETGRHRMWHTGSTFWSTGAHAALVASVVAGSLPRDTVRERVEHEVVYLLPTLPSGPSRPSDARLRFLRGDLGTPAGTPAGRTPAPRGPGALLPSADPAPSRVTPVVFDSVEHAGSLVFVAADLDRVVERDPTSAAPVYPPDLEQQQIEGAVQAEWVVDSTGHADTTTFRVVSATHPGFVDAVRGALPLMRFHPAELAGRAVAQMVRQEFTFRIRLPELETPRPPRP